MPDHAEELAELRRIIFLLVEQMGGEARIPTLVLAPIGGRDVISVHTDPRTCETIFRTHPQRLALEGRVDA